MTHNAEKGLPRPRIESLSVPEQWDRHRETNPRHTATVSDRRPPYTIFCNDCLWHDYGPPARVTPPVVGQGGAA